jgi:hypothetical protein
MNLTTAPSGTSRSTLPSDATALASSTVAAPVDHGDALALTRELFPDSAVEIEAAVDPEIEDEAYYVISVACASEIAALVLEEPPLARATASIGR